MLDDHIIQGLKAADKPKKYADGGGLFLFIPASGKKLWRLAYRFERKAKLLSFGEYPQVSLRAARQRPGGTQEGRTDICLQRYVPIRGYGMVRTGNPSL